MKHYRKVYLGITIAFIALLSFCFLPWVTKALAGGCGTWEGIPTITLKLPGQEKPQHKCEKGKEGAQPHVPKMQRVKKDTKPA